MYKNMKSKTLLWILICLMCISGMNVQASEGIVFQINSQPGKEGDMVTVPVMIQNGGETGGFDVKVYYDAEALEFQELEKGELIRDDGLFDYNHKAEEASIKIIYVVADSIEADGTIANLTFRLKKDCENQLPIGMGIEEVIDNSEEGSPVSGTVEGADAEFQAQVEQEVQGMQETDVKTEDADIKQEEDKRAENKEKDDVNVKDKKAGVKKESKDKAKGGTKVWKALGAGLVVLVLVGGLIFGKLKKK